MRKRLKAGVFCGAALAAAMFSGCSATYSSSTGLALTDRPAKAERFNIDIAKVFNCMGCCQFGVEFGHRLGLELSIKPCTQAFKQSFVTYKRS